jgi:hypothetical protein
MSDPIEQLTRLGDAMEGAPVPLPATAIRARGDQIRRRKHALIAGATAAVIAAVALPLAALTLNGDDPQDPPPADSSVTDPVGPAGLEESNLLTSDEAIYPNGASDWRETATFEGDGPDRFHPCAASPLSALGASSVLRRDFEFVVTGADEVEPHLTLNEAIAEFPSSADARAAYDTFNGWLGDCLPEGADRFDAGRARPVPIPVDGAARTQVSTYGPVEGDEFDELSWFLETGIVLSGDRIAVLTQQVDGQDYDWPEGTPVEQMLPDAASRLVLGSSDDANGGVAGDWVTTIPDGFTILEGSSNRGPDAQAMIPGGDLDACSQSVEAIGAEDRLTQRLTSGSTYYARELQLFADATEAMRYVDSIQDAYSVCAAEDSAYQVESPGGPIAVLWSEGADRSVTIVSRHRNAVLVVLERDDLATDVDTVERMWTGVGEALGPLYEAVDDLVSGTPTTDPTGEPEGTTAIPDDLAIDLDMADMTGDGGEYHTPYHPEAGEQGLDLAPCGTRVWPATAAVDQLWAWATGPEYGDRRELVTFATTDDAVAAMDAVEVALAACPEDGTERWTQHDTDTGYVSLSFSRSYEGLGLEVFQLTRVGRALLLTMTYGEGTLESVPSVLPGRTQLTQAVAPSLCIFTADSCL